MRECRRGSRQSKAARGTRGSRLPPPPGLDRTGITSADGRKNKAWRSYRASWSGADSNGASVRRVAKPPEKNEQILHLDQRERRGQNQSTTKRLSSRPS